MTNKLRYLCPTELWEMLHESAGGDEGWERLSRDLMETRWLARGDGIAVYQNMALDSSTMGRRKYMSYGSPEAQLEMEVPPLRLPDIGPQINWMFQLIAVLPPTKGENYEQPD